MVTCSDGDRSRRAGQRVVRLVGNAVRRVWLTERDEQMFEWFRIVRVSNVQSIRWVLGALNGWDHPVSTRQAQTWCERMEVAGMVHRTNVGGPGGSVVWATWEATGAATPDPYRQTTRHEVAVSAASGRFAVAGYAWQRDPRPSSAGGHQADGVALGLTSVRLIEVELTAKRAPRYVSIFSAYRRRLSAGDADAVLYLCNPHAAKAVRTALHKPFARSIADRVAVHEVFEARTAFWRGESLPTWLTPVEDE